MYFSREYEKCNTYDKITLIEVMHREGQLYIGSLKSLQSTKLETK